jgi:hypothetical protein
MIVTQKILKELDNFEINVPVDKSVMVLKYYPHIDEYTCRAFDVAVCRAKKQLQGKEFKSKNKKFMIRVK